MVPAYEEDFYAWALHQAAVLREMARDRVNVPLDLDHLAEEVADLGKSERDACRSQVRRIIEHFLKLEHSRSAEPRAGWRRSVKDARAILADKLTRSLHLDLLETLQDQYRRAAGLAADGLEEFGEAESAAVIPEECPYALDQILTDGWYPRNRHGLP